MTDYPNNPINAGPFILHVFEGTDGVPVVEVDTSEMPEDKHGPVCRVNLNDSTLYSNPAWPNTVNRRRP